MNVSKVSGIVLDGEATMQLAGRLLEVKHTHMTNTICQAHAISLLLKVRRLTQLPPVMLVFGWHRPGNTASIAGFREAL